MGQPRRRFPGGSVGGYFAICKVADEVLAAPFLTEVEAIQKAEEWTAKFHVRAYIAKYHNHVEPEEPN